MADASRVASDFLSATRVLNRQPTPLGARLKAALAAGDRREIPELIEQALNLKSAGSYQLCHRRNLQIAEKFAAAAEKIGLLDEASALIDPRFTRAGTAQGLELIGMPCLAKLVMIARW
jgi:hypothetical protein